MKLHASQDPSTAFAALTSLGMTENADGLAALGVDSTGDGNLKYK